VIESFFLQEKAFFFSRDFLPRSSREISLSKSFFREKKIFPEEELGRSLFPRRRAFLRERFPLPREKKLIAFPREELRGGASFYLTTPPQRK